MIKVIAFRELITATDFTEVWNCLTRHYEIEKEVKNKYHTFYEKLIELVPVENSGDMYIYINVFKDDGNDDYYCPENFDENDNELAFDVCGKDNEWCGYSLVGNSFEEWLSFYLDDKTLEKLSYPSIIAHCIWEMTF